MKKIIVLALAIGIANSIAWMAAFSLFSFTNRYLYEPNQLIAIIELLAAAGMLILTILALKVYLKGESNA